MDVQRYKKYLVEKYEEKVRKNITASFRSKIEYDEEDNFVFVRVPRDIAFTCKRLLRPENFWVRSQIFYNFQAGRLPLREGYKKKWNFPLSVS